MRHLFGTKRATLAAYSLIAAGEKRPMGANLHPSSCELERLADLEGSSLAIFLVDLYRTVQTSSAIQHTAIERASWNNQLI